MKSPYPWFGGKSKAAEPVWRAFGSVKNYVEPFFGSGAMLLARPDFDGQTETINDADGFVANFWRAVKCDPEAVAWWADDPVNEVDIIARHGWLVNRRSRLTWSLEDPEFFDAKIAGWWAWGACAWIGSGWCSGKGPWRSDGAHIGEAGNNGQGLNRKLPHLGDNGQGLNRKLPHLGNNGRGLNRQLPHLGDNGRGLNRQLPHLGDNGRGDYIQALSDRFRNVRVACGDWSRVMGESVTIKHGLTAVFLDPPYSDEADRAGVYSVDCGKVAQDVRVWCAENGSNPLLRIALCGYEGEHDMPGWRVMEWKAAGGYGSQGNARGRANSKRERVWFSPHCVSPESTLF